MQLRKCSWRVRVKDKRTNHWKTLSYHKTERTAVIYQWVYGLFHWFRDTKIAYY